MDRATTPTTMRAVSQDTAGAPDVLKVVEVERPEPGRGEILVRVHAAGVNPTDWKTRRRGEFATGARPPFTLGYDVAGVVEAVGAGVTLFQAGDEVFGMPRFPHPAGAYAEYVAAPARHFAPRPDGLTPIQAGALPLASLTAWQALVDTADVQPGQRVLIHAAAGGVEGLDPLLTPDQAHGDRLLAQDRAWPGPWPRQRARRAHPRRGRRKVNCVRRPSGTVASRVISCGRARRLPPSPGRDQRSVVQAVRRHGGHVDGLLAGFEHVGIRQVQPHGPYGAVPGLASGRRRTLPRLVACSRGRTISSR